MRRLSETGIAKLKELEGFCAKPYDDGFGYLTVGYGHRLHDGDTCFYGPLSEGVASRILARDVQHAEQAVDALVTIPLNQNQFDALVLFVYNVGIAAFTESTVLRIINDRLFNYVPHELFKWHFAHKKSVPGLVKRRLAEIHLWETPSKE
jgi:lysozyme